jgi:hypothetical protein
MIGLLDVKRAQHLGRRVTSIIQNFKDMVCYGPAPLDLGRRQTQLRFPSTSMCAAQQRKRHYKHTQVCKGRNPLREASQIHRYALFLPSRFIAGIGN